MADSRNLYQEVILDHNRKPRNWGALADATHKSEGLNPLCGDHIYLSLKVVGTNNEASIEAVQFEGESCAICKASASMMTTIVKGKSRHDAEQMVHEFRDMATGKLDTSVTPHHLGRLTVFAGVRDLPTRVKCAILPWHTLHAALNSQTTTSTEAEADPVHASVIGT
jgi:nitrogen fixation NifU-like protein